MTATLSCSLCGVAVKPRPSRKGMCNHCYYQEYYATHKEQHKASAARWKAAHPINWCRRNKAATKKYFASEKGKDKARGYRLFLFYRITLPEYDRLVSFQRQHPIYALLLNKSNATKREAVEHRHSDGKIRGVMAGMLNRAYGIIERLYPTNTADVLRALALFHERPPADTVLGAARYGIIGRAQMKKVMRYGPNG